MDVTVIRVDFGREFSSALMNASALCEIRSRPAGRFIQLIRSLFTRQRRQSLVRALRPWRNRRLSAQWLKYLIFVALEQVFQGYSFPEITDYIICILFQKVSFTNVITAFVISAYFLIML